MGYYGVEYPQPEEDKFGEDPGAEDARGRFVGPVSFFGKRDADPTWDFINSVYSNANDAAWTGAKYAINSEDLGRQHCIMISFENQANITYDVEVIRHFEIIPAEEAAIECRSVTLSRHYVNALDLIRQYNINQLMSNPFAPSAITTTSTVWNLDHIYSAQSKDIKHLMQAMGPTRNEQIRGIFSQGLRWLVKLLAPQLLAVATSKAADMTNKAISWADQKNRGLTSEEEEEHIADNDSCLADIEKNPGPELAGYMVNGLRRPAHTHDSSADMGLSEEDEKPPP